MITTLIILGQIKIGSVDCVTGDVALVEYVNGSGEMEYHDVSVKNSDCLPAEGDLVFFDANKIYECFERK
tara:strand:- start:6947 stop:7156 length:210 start_codon:yes stop_codon:yes gene_type:complete